MGAWERFLFFKHRLLRELLCLCRMAIVVYLSDVQVLGGLL